MRKGLRRPAILPGLFAALAALAGCTNTAPDQRAEFGKRVQAAASDSSHCVSTTLGSGDRVTDCWQR
jgi:hypothetical protein